MDGAEIFDRLCKCLACLQSTPHATHDLVGCFLDWVQAYAVPGQPNLSESDVRLSIDWITDSAVQDQTVTLPCFCFVFLQCQRRIPEFGTVTCRTFPIRNTVPEFKTVGPLLK